MPKVSLGVAKTPAQTLAALPLLNTVFAQRREGERDE